jgi:hypothetical protein
MYVYEAHQPKILKLIFTYPPPSHVYHTCCTYFTVPSFIFNSKVNVQRGSSMQPSCLPYCSFQQYGWVWIQTVTTSCGFSSISYLLFYAFWFPVSEIILQVLMSPLLNRLVFFSSKNDIFPWLASINLGEILMLCAFATLVNLPDLPFSDSKSHLIFFKSQLNTELIHEKS